MEYDKTYGGNLNRYCQHVLIGAHHLAYPIKLLAFTKYLDRALAASAYNIVWISRLDLAACMQAGFSLPISAFGSALSIRFTIARHGDLPANAIVPAASCRKVGSLTMRPFTKTSARAACAAIAITALLASCSTDNGSPAPTDIAPTDSTQSGASDGADETTASTVYPLDVDTCGVTTTFAAQPQRVVTAKSSSMEMMLALGVGDSIVGTSYQDGELPAWLKAEPGATSTAVTTPLSDKLAGQEALLELEPDLVYVGWESNLSSDGMGTRESYEKLGVNTLVAPSACKEAGYQPDPLTYDDIFSEIQLMGQIFDATTEANRLVDKQREELAQVVKDDRGLTALWYSSGSDIPFVGGGKGSAQLTLDTIGLTNIAADIDDTWGSLAWEKVIEADPDVIVLVDSAWGSTEKKIGVLEGNPATAQLTAVKNKQYLVVPFPATEAGVRSVSAATDLSQQLAKLEVSK